VSRAPNDSIWLQISALHPGYAGDVVTLVARISRTRCGRNILEKIRASGQVIMVEKPATPTQPANAWASVHATRPSTISIFFDPADWRLRAGRWAGDAVLFSLLGEAYAMAIGAEPADITSAAVEAYLQERTSSLVSG
jgi:hypothetical protein